jgi:2-polyprenyl-3-methyl-5-hydroxy-6-metoxy-1,4-benzoquinol methylase
MQGFAAGSQRWSFAPGVSGRVLDYGCAVGLFVKVAADAGWQALGCDRSEWATSLATDVSTTVWTYGSSATTVIHLSTNRLSTSSRCGT